MRDSRLNEGNERLYAAHHLGSAILQSDTFAGQSGSGISITGSGGVTSQQIEMDQLLFSFPQGPIIVFNGTVGDVSIRHMETERSLANPKVQGDIVYGTGNFGRLVISSSSLGVNTQYSIYNTPANTLLINDDLGSTYWEKYTGFVTSIP